MCTWSTSEGIFAPTKVALWQPYGGAQGCFTLAVFSSPWMASFVEVSRLPDSLAHEQSAIRSGQEIHRSVLCTGGASINHSGL